MTPRIFLAAVIVAWAAPVWGCVANSLSVDKVEPPNWWIGMQHSQVQLLVYGKKLRDVEVASKSTHVKVLQVESSKNGSYCFVDVEISAEATAGIVRLAVSGKSGSQEVEFPILERDRGGTGQQGFGPQDVIYLITPDRFANGDPRNDRALIDEFNRDDPTMRHGGDLQGIIDRLDYIADLGVTTLWLNPILENRGINSYHGYKTTDYYRIDPRFGSNEDYCRLVNEAHLRSLKVVFDHVTNHVGLGHPWVADRPQPDWFNGSASRHLSNKHHLYAPSDPYADKTTIDELRQFWFIDRMPDLNQANDRLSTYLIQNAIWWVEFSQLDGFREDTYPYADPRHMQRLVEALELEFPRVKVVGEIWALEPAYVAQYQRGSPLAQRNGGHLPAVMDFPLMDVYRRYIQGRAELKDIYQKLATDFVYGDPSMLVTFFENHDTPRALYIADGKTDRLKIALHLLLTTRGIPQLLYGSEINMYGGPRHVELRADFPGGFPGDRRNAFSRSGRTGRENEMIDFLRQLLHLRKEYKALSHGSLTHFPPVENVYIHVKKSGGQKILSIVNGNAESRQVDLSSISSQVSPQANLVDLCTETRYVAANGIPLQPMQAMLLEVK